MPEAAVPGVPPPRPCRSRVRQPAGALRLGTSVGELARKRFPGGVLVEEQYFERRQAERATRRLLTDESIPALYEPAFSFESVHTRVDILRRTEDGRFDQIEVKSSTSLKDVHIPDVAIQTHVLEGCGLTIRNAYLMRIDNSYVYQGGEHDLERLFALDDVTDQIRSFMETEVHGHLGRMWEALGTARTLEIGTGGTASPPTSARSSGIAMRTNPSTR